MVVTPTRKTRATLVTSKAVEQARIFFQKLPEKAKDNLSLKEAINNLHVSLKDALKKGYTYGDLAKLLTEKGIKISTFTLKTYIPAGKRTTISGKTRKSSKAPVSVSAELQPSEVVAPTVKPARSNSKSAKIAPESTATTVTKTTVTKSPRSRAKTVPPVETSSENQPQPKSQPKAKQTAARKSPTKNAIAKTQSVAQPGKSNGRRKKANS